MDIDDLRREAIRCRNLADRTADLSESAWYRDRGIRLAQAVEAMAADATGAKAAL
jgi:hypothetical protein